MALSDVKVIWNEQDISSDSLLLSNLVDYQKQKFKVLKERILESYYANSELLKNYPLKQDLKNAPSYFIIAIIVKIVLKQDEKILYLMHEDEIFKVHLKYNDTLITSEENSDLIEGLQLGFYGHSTSHKKPTKKGLNGGLKDVLMVENSDYYANLKGLIWPQLKQNNWSSNSTNKVVIASDIHCGSLLHLQSNFLNLIYRINQDPLVKYLILNGDTIDGTNVYKSHYLDLEIDTSMKQYEKLAKNLSNLRPDVTLIVAPGNHDHVIRSEPQYFSKDIKNIFTKYFKNTIFLPNPSYFSIEGVYFYLTHGTSLNSLIGAVPRLKEDRIVDAVEFLTKISNISPIRNAVPIRPNSNLQHLIPSKVDVISAGHMHQQGIFLKKGRIISSTGAWQHLTNYMKLLGIKPSLAKAICIQLDGNFQEWCFEDESTNLKSLYSATLSAF